MSNKNVFKNNPFASLADAVKNGELKVSAAPSRPVKKKPKAAVVRSGSTASKVMSPKPEKQATEKQHRKPKTQTEFLTPDKVSSLTAEEIHDIAMNKGNVIGPVRIRSKEDREAFLGIELTGGFKTNIITRGETGHTFLTVKGTNKETWTVVENGFLRLWESYGIKGVLAKTLMGCKIPLRYDLAEKFAIVWQDSDLRNIFLNRPSSLKEYVTQQDDAIRENWLRGVTIPFTLTRYQEEQLARIVVYVEDALASNKVNANSKVKTRNDSKIKLQRSRNLKPKPKTVVV